MEGEALSDAHFEQDGKQVTITEEGRIWAQCWMPKGRPVLQPAEAMKLLMAWGAYRCGMRSYVWFLEQRDTIAAGAETR